MKQQYRRITLLPCFVKFAASCYKAMKPNRLATSLNYSSVLAKFKLFVLARYCILNYDLLVTLGRSYVPLFQGICIYLIENNFVQSVPLLLYVYGHRAALNE